MNRGYGHEGSVGVTFLDAASQVHSGRVADSVCGMCACVYGLGVDRVPLFDTQGGLAALFGTMR